MTEDLVSYNIIPLDAPKSSSASGPTGSPEKAESFYERILRLGYGPPDGDKLDRAGWRRYFDEIPDLEHYNMILDVFGHVLPEQWKPERIRIYFLDGVDKNLTLRSHAFSRCPRYQYIWQNGYGPPDGDTLDIKEWKKYLAEMPRDKHKNMSNDLFTIPRDRDHDAKLYEMYLKQIKETQGFDIDVFVPGGGGTIGPMFYDMSLANGDVSLNNYSKNAVDVYNGREGSDYTVTRVVKACMQCVAGMIYYITFEAINFKDHLQVFQAKVYDDPVRGTEEILLVRPKPEKA